MIRPGDPVPPAGQDLKETTSPTPTDTVRNFLRAASRYRASGDIAAALEAVTAALALDATSVTARLVHLELRQSDAEAQLVLDKLARLAKDPDVARQPYLALALLERVAAGRPNDETALIMRSRWRELLSFSSVGGCRLLALTGDARLSAALDRLCLTLGVAFLSRSPGDIGHEVEADDVVVFDPTTLSQGAATFTFLKLTELLTSGAQLVVCEPVASPLNHRDKRALGRRGVVVWSEEFGEITLEGFVLEALSRQLRASGARKPSDTEQRAGERALPFEVATLGERLKAAMRSAQTESDIAAGKQQQHDAVVKQARDRLEESQHALVESHGETARARQETADARLELASAAASARAIKERLENTVTERLRLENTLTEMKRRLDMIATERGVALARADAAATSERETQSELTSREEELIELRRRHDELLRQQRSDADTLAAASSENTTLEQRLLSREATAHARERRAAEQWIVRERELLDSAAARATAARKETQRLRGVISDLEESTRELQAELQTSRRRAQELGEHASREQSRYEAKVADWRTLAGDAARESESRGTGLERARAHAEQLEEQLTDIEARLNTSRGEQQRVGLALDQALSAADALRESLIESERAATLQAAELVATTSSLTHLEAKSAELATSHQRLRRRTRIGGALVLVAGVIIAVAARPPTRPTTDSNSVPRPSSSTAETDLGGNRTPSITSPAPPPGRSRGKTTAARRAPLRPISLAEYARTEQTVVRRQEQASYRVTAKLHTPTEVAAWYGYQATVQGWDTTRLRREVGGPDGALARQYRFSERTYVELIVEDMGLRGSFDVNSIATSFRLDFDGKSLAGIVSTWEPPRSVVASGVHDRDVRVLSLRLEFATATRLPVTLEFRPIGDTASSFTWGQSE